MNTRAKCTPTSAEDAVRTLLDWVGVDYRDDSSLVDTPARVVRAWREMTGGYDQDPASILARSFPVDHSQIVLLDRIRFTSLCEHHILPFQGEAAVAYIPDGQVVGISKLARIVECYAHRLQVQERLTDQIADAVAKHVQTKGVAVIMRAHHECMGCRGVRQPGARMTTSALRGAFMDKPEARAELMALMEG